MQLARDHSNFFLPAAMFVLAPFTPVYPPLYLRRGMFPFAPNGSQLPGMNAVTSLTAPWVRTASSKELIGLNVLKPCRGAQIWRAWKPAGALAWWHASGWLNSWLNRYFVCTLILMHGQENADLSSSLVFLSLFLFRVSREPMQDIWPPIVAQSLCSIGISFNQAFQIR